MGFYLELRRQNTLPLEFSEEEIPVSFWFLFIVAGFALACMGAAAFTLFGDLWNRGDGWDKLLILTIFSSVPFYLAIGFKLFCVRKFVQLDGDTLKMGFRIGNLRWALRKLTRSQIRNIDLNNRRPTSNLAPREHDNPQYYIRGHWRLMAQPTTGREFALDKHTEKEMLEDLNQAVVSWWKGEKG